MEHLKFDIIDFEKQAPQGYCYAWGFDSYGTSYYSLCELNDGIIGNVVKHDLVLKFKFSNSPLDLKLMKSYFENKKDNSLTLKQTA